MRRVLPIAGLLLVTAACQGPPEEAPRTIVLVSIDTLRADHVGAYGYPLETTPFLDSLAERSVLFEKAISSSSHTAPSHASMLTSLYPEAHGVLRNGAALDGGRVETLAEVLSEAGYETAMFSSVTFLSELAAGFDEVDATYAPDEPGYRLATNTISAAAAWVDGRPAGSALFMLVHLYDVHEHGETATPPAEDLARMDREMRAHPGVLERHLGRVRRQGGRFRPWKLRSHLRRYDAQLAHVDRELRRLYEAVEAKRPGQDSLWIVTSDHGEGLGNHDLLGHGAHLYNEQLRVPLIVHRSASERGLRIERMVRLVDLMPTVLELVGVEEASAERRIEGVSLVPLLSAPDAPVPIDLVYAQRRPIDDERRENEWRDGLVLSVQSDRDKYILYEHGTSELFDLGSDPHEIENLVEIRPERAEVLRRWLLDRYSRMHAERPPDAGKVLPKYRRDLETLGYVN